MSFKTYAGLLVLMLVGLVAGTEYATNWIDIKPADSGGVAPAEGRMFWNTSSQQVNVYDANLQPVGLDGRLACDYLVYTNGTHYFAKNCSTGVVEKSGTNFAVVVNAVVSNDTSIIVKNTGNSIRQSSRILLTGLNNVKLVGEKTQITLVNDTNFVFSGDSAQRNVEIEGFIIDANNQNANSIVISFGGQGKKENIVLSDIVINNSRQTAIWCGGGGGCYNSHFSNILIENSLRGIQSTTIYSSMIEKIRGKNLTYELVMIAGNTAYTPPYTKDNKVEDITLINGTIAVDITRSVNTVVKNVWCFDCVKAVNGEPLFDITSGQPFDRAVIEDIYAFSPQKSGIYITYGVETKIRGCTIKDAGYGALLSGERHGVLFQVYNGSITGCVVYNSSGYGIAIGSGRHNNLIEGNKLLYNNQSGIYLYGAYNNVILGNMIVGNGYGSSYAGVFIEGPGATNNLIIGNIFENNKNGNISISVDGNIIGINNNYKSLSMPVTCSAPYAGMQWYNTSSNTLYYCNSTDWVAM